jgi:predicted metal-dependent phosphoesterase TrpH
VITAAAGGIAMTGLGASSQIGSSAAATETAGTAVHPWPRLRPVSMAMHIHGPFSEGIGSFEAHLAEARRTDVDVIWWTDHDFRVAAHDHRRAVHFDGASEPEGELSWTWAQRTEGTVQAPTVEFVDEPHSPEDPGRALRLAATGGDSAGGILWYAATAFNFTYSTCIADTTLELDVRPESAEPGAAALLQMDLSYHPQRGGRPAGSYLLRYRFGGVAEPRHVAEGLLGTVELPAEPGAWRRFTLRLVDDVRALWPDLVAEDNSLRNLRVGVAAPAGVTASAVLDRLLFHRARRGQAGEDLRAEVLARYRDEYADVTHFRGYEISLVRHLNWYGGDQTMPSFPSPPLRDNDPALTASMIDFLHSHGGVVCWNHPMDVESRESLATLMIERANLGADLVEIGRNPLPDLMWVFDVAARNAVFFTAVGSSDDHGGRNWLDQEERWITYAWSASTGERDLVDALRRGRAWFTDPVAYRGELNLTVLGLPAMGAVLVTRLPVVPVSITATDLPADATLEVVTGVVDRAGTADLAPKTEVRPLRSVLLSPGPYLLPLVTRAGVYVRTQVRSADGAIIAVSNPFWVLPEAPGGLPDSRRLA